MQLNFSVSSIFIISNINLIKMKTFSIILSLIFLHISSSIFATDIYVNSSGQSGTYTTIGAAITAASSGDRIFISPYGTYTENLSIDKSLTLTSSASGTNFNVIGNITIAADAGNEVRIIGCICSGSIYAATGTAVQNNMANFYLIDSEVSFLSLAGFIKTHALFCNNITNVTIWHGEIIGCKISNNFTINDGPNAGTGDTVKIIGNVLRGKLTYNSDDDLFYISNNFFNSINDLSPTASRSCVLINNSHYNTSANNVFNNNTFLYYSGSSHAYGVKVIGSNQSNILVTNNIFEDLYTSSYGGTDYSFLSDPTNLATVKKPKASYNYSYGSCIWNGIIPNTILGQASGPSNFNYDDYGRSVDPRIVNSGSPSIQHYDIDMTINDLGTYGGPHSIDNYINTTNGKARIFDLNMPFEIWTGQTPTITAKGVHTK